MKILIFQFLDRDSSLKYEVYVCEGKKENFIKRESFFNHSDAVTAAKFLSVEHRAPITDFSNEGR